MAGARSAGRRLRQLAGIDVGVLHGVGPARRRALGALGIDTVLDLLTYYPYRYLDQTRQVAVADLAVGEAAWVIGEVSTVHLVGAGRGAGRGSSRLRSRVEVIVDDGTGTLRVTFFNQPYRAKQLPVGTRALFFGRLQLFRGQRQFTNPDVDLIGARAGRVVALYPTSGQASIASWQIADLVAEALDRAGRFADPLPGAWRQRLGLMDRTSALRAIHQPATLDAWPAARQRLAFDELLRLQLDVLQRRYDAERLGQAIAHPLPPGTGGGDLVGRFVSGLPFLLTGAQRRAIDEIRRDMAAPRPMQRLLQGDVGSGKTVVAVATLLTAVQGGFQGALMAPTEVLAEQHFLGLRTMVEPLEKDGPRALGARRALRVALLTGRVPAAARRRTVDALARREVDIVVGTHALLTEDVRFASLGAVVIDEQHRFGVEQRALLRERAGSHGGPTPDLLVMTATPIPRTAAMVLLGDLDVTELTELPAGRAPVTTALARSEVEREQAWAKVRSEVAAGHRAYVVCPLVEASARTEAAAATDERERLADEELAGLSLGLLHGQMSPASKELAMARFRSGETPVLVATTVIEVGVDVPEATVMVVEDAARFGMAQLHQLRGRVGRAELASWCFLLHGPGLDTGSGACRAGAGAGAGAGSGGGGAGAPAAPEDGAPGGAGACASGLEVRGADDAERRLEAVAATSDGFALAEVDLELRGEGTLFGTRQQGRNDLKLATLRRRDHALVRRARQVASALLEDDPRLERAPLLADELDLLLRGTVAEFPAKR